MPADSSKRFANWHMVSVCLAVKLKVASLFFSCNAFFKSCDASLAVSLGSIAGVLQCTGKNFSEFVIL